MERFWCDIAAYVINLCVDHFTYSVGHWRAGPYTKRNMMTEAGHIGHTFAKYCRLKLAENVMKYWLYFVARVG